MQRALVVLTLGAFLTVLVESTAVPHPLTAVTVAGVFGLLEVVAFRLVDRQEPRRRRRSALVYVVVMVPLGYLMFGVTGPGVGGTLLLLVLVSQSVLLLPLRAAVVVTATVPLVHIGMTLGDGLRNGLGAVAAAAFTLVVTELLRREQRARAELTAAHERLRGYAAQAEELATTQERNRLARDIHDGLGHHLTVVSMQVQAARAVLPSDPAKADEVLGKAQVQATEALAEVRRSVAALREPRAAAPLDRELKELTEETSAAGVPTELHVTGTVRPLAPEAEEALFRAAQEGLTNVRKHAAATSARLVLDYADADADADADAGGVRLEVCDDGRGMPPPGAGAGFGLLGLRERAAGLGGRVTVESPPGRGTTLRLELPA